MEDSQTKASLSEPPAAEADIPKPLSLTSTVDHKLETGQDPPVGEKTESVEVSWDGPDDPEKPRNWPIWKKGYNHHTCLRLGGSQSLCHWGFLSRILRHQLYLLDCSTSQQNSTSALKSPSWSSH